MEWYYIVIAFGTLVTAGIEIWWRLIRPHLQGQEKKYKLEKAEKSNLLQDYKDVRGRIKVEIEQTLDYRFHGNIWSFFPDSISPEMRTDLVKFTDILWECRAWWYAGKQTIRLAIWYSIAQYLPRTFVNYPEMWDDFSDDLTYPILKGEKVGKSWLEENKIMTFRKLRDNFNQEDGSDAINEFFRLLHNKLEHQTQHEQILEALQTKIEELKGFGEEIIKKIDKENSELENRIEQLKKLTS